MIGRPADHSSTGSPAASSQTSATAERLAAEHPEAFMRRRDFLGRTAALAGLAGMARVLPAETLVAEAAKRAAARRRSRAGGTCRSTPSWS